MNFLVKHFTAIASTLLATTAPVDGTRVAVTITDPVGHVGVHTVYDSDFVASEAGERYSSGPVEIWSDDGVYLGELLDFDVTYSIVDAVYVVQADLDFLSADLWDTQSACEQADKYRVQVDFDWIDVPPGLYESRLHHGIFAQCRDKDAVLCLHGATHVSSGGYVGYDLLGRSDLSEWREYATGLMLFAYGECGGGAPNGSASTDVPVTGWRTFHGELDAFRMTLDYELSEGDRGSLFFDQRVQSVSALLP